MNPEFLMFPSSLVGGLPRPRRPFTDPFSSPVPSWGDVPEADSEAVPMAPLRRRRSCFFDDGPRSEIREGDLDNMRRKYAIHPSVGMRSPTEFEHAPDGGAGERCSVTFNPVMAPLWSRNLRGVSGEITPSGMVGTAARFDVWLSLVRCFPPGFLCWRSGSEAYNGNSLTILMDDLSGNVARLPVSVVYDEYQKAKARKRRPSYTPLPRLARAALSANGLSSTSSTSVEVGPNRDPLVVAHRRLIGEVFLLRGQMQDMVARRDLLVQQVKAVGKKYSMKRLLQLPSSRFLPPGSGFLPLGSGSLPLGLGPCPQVWVLHPVTGPGPQVWELPPSSMPSDFSCRKINGNLPFISSRAHEFDSRQGYISPLEDLLLREVYDRLIPVITTMKMTSYALCSTPTTPHTGPGHGGSPGSTSSASESCWEKIFHEEITPASVFQKIREIDYATKRREALPQGLRRSQSEFELNRRREESTAELNKIEKGPGSCLWVPGPEFLPPSLGPASGHGSLPPGNQLREEGIFLNPRERGSIPI
ncbi:hypothetical protein DY000_02040777 [Brassica cretica]|uniref:Uncharacterized protein n=1 Tax=Brassica cretica TaxID=69181 RepID=A0ABQ7BH88_BRACR|nr:hypothetical protein DY000_02040777 [Brassica cretica]